MKRTPEPEELMDEAEQALAYAEADFSASNTQFMALFHQLHPQDFSGKVLDLGCGPADIPIRFARQYPQAEIHALDGAQAMLNLAQQAIDKEALSDQISLHCHYLPATELDKDFDAILSNSLLHHLRDPLDLWRSIQHAATTGALILVMDLLRPETPQQVNSLLNTYASDAPDVLRRDFAASLHAAYTVEEVREQLASTALNGLDVRQVSDRHLAVMGSLD